MAHRADPSPKGVLRREEAKARRDQLIAAFLRLVRIRGLPDPLLEHTFHPERRWRFDAAWTDQKVAVELQGGTFTGGAHVRGERYAEDCDKLNAATQLGWRVLWLTTLHINRRGLAALDPLVQLLDRTTTRS